MNAYLENITVEAIGPKEAIAYLKRGTLKYYDYDKVDKYIEAMETGKWGYPGGTIEIDVRGNLKDGHHRLKSVIEAGVVIPMIIVRGVTVG